MRTKKIVLAYSGGLDTSAIIPWLIETYKAEVICYCADLGNSLNQEEIGKRAMSLGASEFIFEDLVDEFAQDYIAPFLKSGALYQEDYLLGTALARPLISKKIVQVAKNKKAFALAHGATGKGNDQIRFEKAWSFLAPELEIIAPWKIWDLKGRGDLLNYLKSKDFEYSEGKKTYSEDLNLMHRSCEGLDLEKIEKNYDSEKTLLWCKKKDRKSEKISLSFKQGVVTSVNGKEQSISESIKALNALGSDFGIGVVDIVEERVNGIKSRGIYETPGCTILHFALKQLKQICWSKDLYTLSQRIGIDYADLIYKGAWFSQARVCSQAFFEQASQLLSGEVCLELSLNQIKVCSRSSKYSLYQESLVSFEQDEYGVLEASSGFCKTLNLISKQEGAQYECFKNQA